MITVAEMLSKGYLIMVDFNDILKLYWSTVTTKYKKETLRDFCVRIVPFAQHRVEGSTMIFCHLGRSVY